MSRINFTTLITSHKELLLVYANLFNELRNCGLSTNQVIEEFENFQRMFQELEERAAGALPDGLLHAFITSHKNLQLAYTDVFNEWRNGGLSTNQVIAAFENFQRMFQELEERVVAAVLGGGTKPLRERVAAAVAAVMKEFKEVKLEEEEEQKNQLHQAAAVMNNNNDNNNNNNNNINDIVRDKVAAAAAELSIPFIDLTGMNEKASCRVKIFSNWNTQTIFYDPKGIVVGDANVVILHDNKLDGVRIVPTAEHHFIVDCLADHLGDDGLTEEEYVIERIVAEKTIKGQKHYLVEWKGYSKSENTWQP
ncbi:hypothetical protein HK104_001271 [Borealophlyctis nickersoniae]|nr:hypothetical protein HK104_001271 [Borealophlyctis nickersoniae]